MKYFIKLSLLVFACAIFFSACNKSNDPGKMIPKNAMIIVHMNAKSLSSKLSWDEVKQTTWFNHLSSDSSKPSWTKAIMDDPQKTGIDIKSDLIFFVIKNMENEEMVFEGDVKDSKTFGDFIKNLNTNSAVGKDGDLNTFTLNKGVIVWNNKKFAMIADAPQHSMQMNDSTLHDSTKSTAPAIASSGNLMSVCKSFFSLSSDTSMEKNEKFSNLLKDDGDIHYWQNTEELMKVSMPAAAAGMLGMLKLDVFFKENISTITASFDNGKISFKQRMYAGKEFTDVLKKLNNANLNTDMVKNISAQNLAAVIAWHFNPEGFLELIKLTGLDGFINIFLVQKGLSLDDIVKATKGDVVFALSDLKMKKDSTIKDTATHMRHKEMIPEHTFLFSTSVGDKDAFNKVLNAVKELDKTMNNQSQPNYKMNDNYFVAGNSADAINNYLAGKKTDHVFLDKIKGHPFGGFADLQMILKSLGNNFTTDSLSKMMYDINVKMWDNIFITGGEYKDGGFIGNGEINLVDKSTNSLRQMNKYFDGISQYYSMYTQFKSSPDTVYAPESKPTMHGPHNKKSKK
ncbi:MAG: DUF4836 family protein [Bacteroidota bacterium]|nr:DUF4836 family protein [Bacteroidota bacterium]